MAVFVSDRMDGADWQRLTQRNGQVGATWAQHPTDHGGGGVFYMYGGKTHCGVAGANYASGVPAGADYDVECDYAVQSDIGSVSIAGRMSTSEATYYYTYYGGGYLVLVKKVDGVLTTLDAWPTSLSGTHRLKLEMRGTAIRVYLDGVLRCEAADGSITAAGRAGVRAGGVNDKSTGKHIDTFVATDLSVPARARSQVAGIVGL